MGGRETGPPTLGWSIAGTRLTLDTFDASSSQPPWGLHVKTKAAILWEVNTPWSVEEIELDPPKPGEVLVKIAASGMCHSDEHLRHRRPAVRAADHRRPRGRRRRRGGRRGRQLAGARRPRRVRVHPVVRPLRQLLDRPPEPVRPRRADGPRHADHRRHGPPPRQGQGPRPDVPARHVRPSHRRQRGQLHQDRQGRPARPGLPARLRRRHRLGLQPSTPPRSRPGDTVAVVGVGGIGANAIQGAKLAGAKRIIAIDPIEFKREKAMEFGATHTVRVDGGGAARLITELTWGTMANKVDHDDGRRLRRGASARRSR